jgi:hypothetical protein
MSSVKYKLCFYIPEDGVLHIHSLEYLKSYINQEVDLAECVTIHRPIRDETSHCRMNYQ